MPSAIIYAAKSTQDRKDSISTQLEDCREMAAENGWTVAGEYRDENFSAYSGNRGPGLTAAREHAARLAAEGGPDEIVYLVAQAHDRFARGAGDRPGAPQSLGEIWHATRRQNVHLRTAEDDDELRDEAAVAAIGRRAHIDSKRKSKSVKKGMARKRATGVHTGGVVYGYDRDPVKGLTPNPVQAAVVQRIFAAIAAGTSQNEIRRQLNQEGVPTARDGGVWQQGTISRMVRSRVYLGELPDDNFSVRKARNIPEQWRPGRHDPIIDAELWEAANATRGRAAGLRGRRGGPRPKAGHLLPGRLLMHADCGRAMTPASGDLRADGTLNPRYICSGRAAGVCDGLRVPMADLDGAVIDYLADVVIDTEASIAAATAATAAETASRDATLAEARKDADRAAANLERIRADYVAGTITGEDWSGLKPDLEAQRIAAESRVATLEAAQTEPAAKVAGVTTALDLLRAAKDDGDSDAILAAIDAVFERFVIGGSDALAEGVLAEQAEMLAGLGNGTARVVLAGTDESATDAAGPAVRDEITAGHGDDALAVLPIPHEGIVAVREDGRPAFGEIVLRRG